MLELENNVNVDAIEIANEEKQIERTTKDVVYVNIDNVKEDEDNGMSLSDIEGLANNIKSVGLMNPIKVYLDDDGNYKIVSGHRRYNAIKKILDNGEAYYCGDVRCIGKKIPIEVCEFSDTTKTLESKVAENNTRKLTAEDRQKRLDDVLKLYGIKKSAGEKIPGGKLKFCADMLGVDEKTIQRDLAKKNGKEINKKNNVALITSKLNNFSKYISVLDVSNINDNEKKEINDCLITIEKQVSSVRTLLNR